MPTTSRRRGAAAIASAAVLSSLLAACGGQDSSDGSGATELALAAFSGPNSLDPAQLVDGQQMFVWSSILDTLLARDYETGELIPNAAESWEYNEDGTELTLHLRDDMTFSDGDPVDAAAVAATMERNRTTAGIVQVKYGAVESVTAVDEHTVTVAFTHNDPQFLPNLALSTGAIGDPDTLDEERTATDPIGSGPYTLDVANTVPGTTYVLKKREDYWNADAYDFEKVTVRVLQDPTASLNALQAGEINAATVQAQVAGQLDQNRFALQQIDAQATAYLDILDRGGEQWPALGDVRVRQAINYAIDREGILDSIMAGVGMATTQIYSPYGEVYDESLNDAYPYDPDKGRALVEEAGYEGTVFTIPSTFLSTSYESVLSQAFKDIGLGLEWEAVPPQQAQSAHLSGDYPLSFQVTGFNSPEADSVSHFGASGYSNPRGYTDDTVDALFEQINSTVDLEEALPSYRELNAYAVEQAFEAPIVFTGGLWATADGISLTTTGASTISTVRLFDVES